MLSGQDAQTGDALARGAVKKSFPPAGGHVSAERWAEIWAEDSKVEEVESKEKSKES